MDDLETIQSQHTAGPQLIGFDYQFYYFMYLALELKHGQQIGFEVKDDIHIDKPDGTTVLFQAKHTILKNADGTYQNLTKLDVDLWKSLSNWSNFIKKAKDASIFLSINSFCLVTNKSESNNEFIESLLLFKIDRDIDKMLVTLKILGNKTTDKNIKAYIKNISSLGKRKLTTFLSNLTIETNTNDIIGDIRNRILERVMQEKFIDPVFESLASNMQLDKYLEIEGRNKFIISLEEFINKYGKCFQVAFESKPLPRRNIPFDLPTNLEDQIFIKQLLDIGEIKKNSPKIIDYTTQMLKTLNQFSYWIDNNFVLPTEMEEFEIDSILDWQNKFIAKYRKIENQIESGTLLESLQIEIENLGVELVDDLRRKDLSLLNRDLGINLSNGHLYALSNKPSIGWHYKWDEKHIKR